MIINAEQASDFFPIFKGKRGKFLFDAACRITGLDRANQAHQHCEDAGLEPGPDFAKGLLDFFEIDFQIGNPQRLAFPEGPFIIISNHFYGHMDGIALVDIVGHVRPDTKVMVNELLMWTHGLAPNFISVNPTLKRKKEATSTSILGIKNALSQLRNGSPLCLFPSGAVADLKPFRGWSLHEREWQDAALKLIRKARVPIVPIRFFDHNSWFYYILGLIDYRIRLLRLFKEVDNKHGTSPRIGIGETISPEKQDSVSEADFKAFLRSSVYDMPMPDKFVKRSQLWIQK